MSPHRGGKNNTGDKGQANLLDLGFDDPVMKIATKTRTGYIPSKPQKTNQDKEFHLKNFGGIRNNWLFGVCDGHGINGHFASDHVKKQLPSNIELIDVTAIRHKN